MAKSRVIEFMRQIRNKKIHEMVTCNAKPLVFFHRNNVWYVDAEQVMLSGRPEYHDLAMIKNETGVLAGLHRSDPGKNMIDNYGKSCKNV